MDASRFVNGPWLSSLSVLQLCPTVLAFLGFLDTNIEHQTTVVLAIFTHFVHNKGYQAFSVYPRMDTSCNLSATG